MPDTETGRALAAALLVTRLNPVGRLRGRKSRIRRSSILEYRYRHGGRSFVLFVSPEDAGVVDAGGPVAQAAGDAVSLAKDALQAGEHEAGYRHSLRALCMPGAGEKETKMFEQALATLVGTYNLVGFAVLIVVSLLAWLVHRWGFLPMVSAWPLGILFVPVFNQLFSQDAGVRLTKRSRFWAAFLLGILGTLGGMHVVYAGAQPQVEGARLSWWLGWMPVLLSLAGFFHVSIVRGPEREKVSSIEALRKACPGPRELEARVRSLEPTLEGQRRSLLLLATLVVLQLALFASLITWERHCEARATAVASERG